MSHLKVVALAILLVLLGKHQRRRRIRELVFESLGRARSRDDDLLRLLQHATIPRGRTAALSSNGALSLWRNGSTSGDRTLADGKFAS
jgi:hypothetical protein